MILFFQILLVVMLVCFIIACLKAYKRDAYKDYSAWFYTGYAIAVVLWAFGMANLIPVHSP